MGEDLKLTNKHSGIWIQPGGANRPVYYLGNCMDVDSVNDPRPATTNVHCLNSKGNGYDVVAQLLGEPDKVSLNITGMPGKTRGWLDRQECPFNLYVRFAACGGRDSWIDADRVLAIRSAQPEGRTFNTPVSHTDQSVTVQYPIGAKSPLYETARLSIDRKTTAETLAANRVVGIDGLVCNANGCAAVNTPGEFLVAVYDSAAGPAKASVEYSLNGGVTWTACAADPGVAGINLMSALAFYVGSTRRILVAQEDTVGAQGYVYYSDDLGATWTSVTIGGAAAGHGAAMPEALYMVDSEHIWLASALGYIYFSADGGATWTVQEAGSIVATDYNSICFLDANYGVAAGVGGVVALTRDGGATWYAGTVVTGAPAVSTIAMPSDGVLWAGTATGLLYYSEDFGVTWTGRTSMPGSGVGQVRSMDWADELTGFIAKNTAAPVGALLRTVNGGYTWEAISTPANSGLNSVWVADRNTIMLGGEANGGTAYIARAED